MSTVSAQALRRALQGGQRVAIVDVREPHEVAQGRIPGARNVPLGALSQSAHALPRDVPLVAYCRSGARSAQAVALLQRMGFRNASSLEGGFEKWSRAAPAFGRRIV